MLEANMFYFKREKHFISGNIFKHKINRRGCVDCYFRFHFCREYPCYIIDSSNRSTSTLVLWK